MNLSLSSYCQSERELFGVKALSHFLFRLNPDRPGDLKESFDVECLDKKFVSVKNYTLLLFWFYSFCYVTVFRTCFICNFLIEP